MRKLIPQPSSSSLRSGPSPKSRPRTTRHDRRRRQQAFQALLQRQQDNISDNKRNFLSGGLWLGACISIALVRHLACKEGRRTSRKVVNEWFFKFTLNIMRPPQSRFNSLVRSAESWHHLPGRSFSETNRLPWTNFINRLRMSFVKAGKTYSRWEDHIL